MTSFLFWAPSDQCVWFLEIHQGAQLWHVHLLGVYQQFRNEEGFQAKSLKINTERGRRWPVSPCL